MTKLAAYGMPQELLGVLNDTPELAAGFCVFLSAPAKYADTDIFRGRWVTIAHWGPSKYSHVLTTVTIDTFRVNGM